VEIQGARIRPLDFTSRLLFPLWHLEEGEEDFTVMRVRVEGKENGRRVRFEYELLDRYDRSTGTSSMARTTGYTCTAAVRMVARGMYRQKGISPPEFIGRHADCYRFILEELGKRGVVFRETITRE
jgi:lysine 6-dehydrogenase